MRMIFYARMRNDQNTKHQEKGRHRLNSFNTWEMNIIIIIIIISINENLTLYVVLSGSVKENNRLYLQMGFDKK